MRRDYRQRNTEALREYDRNRPRNGTAEQKDYQRSYYLANRDRIRAHQKASRRSEATEIRDWARSRGIPVKYSGRLSPALRRAFHEEVGA